MLRVGEKEDTFFSSTISATAAQAISYSRRSFLTHNHMSHLLIIDPQVSFHPGGSLAIPTADEDAARIADLISSNIEKIDSITVTLDSHHKLHIAHPLFWDDAGGGHPPPFTLITNADVYSGKWTPSNLENKEWCLSYTAALEKAGKFTLCIWPEHCLMGSEGHNVVPVINEALNKWIAGDARRSINWVMKGQNLLTEMYSAMAADVPVPSDPSTQFNQPLFDSLQASSKLLVCGQAMR